MATSCVRSTRKLKPWLVEQVDSGRFPGLMWDDEQKSGFRIPWKHAGKQDFRHDEDAAIFKAWAVYKNKFHSGDRLDAAAWKTRLRCALNKSPEFQELPARSQLDISEPYKVYRLVPPGEQVTPISGRKRKIPARRRDSSSDEGETDRVQKRPNLIKLELSHVDNMYVSSSVTTEDSGIGSDTSNPETHKATQLNPESLRLTLNPVLPTQITHTDMLVTVQYSGVEVSRCLVHSGECKILAEAPWVGPLGGMELVLLPPPDAVEDAFVRSRTQDLLGFLEAGVMLGSNTHGVFAQRQRKCLGRVFWAGPCARQGEEANKLERDAHVKLFDTQIFLRELATYRAGQAAAPEYRVTLCFGEEISDRDPVMDKLITAQVEQVMAAELVREVSESLQGAASLNPLLQDPPAPYLNPLLPLDTHEGGTGMDT